MLGAEFERTKVAPEGDAFVFAQLAGTPNISKIQADLSDGLAIRDALRVATTTMDNDKVPKNQRFLYIKAGYKGLVDDLDTTKSREIFNRFDKIIEVPEPEFYTAIRLNDIEDEEDGLNGGYDKLEPTYKASEDTSVQSGKTYYTKSGETYTKVESPTGNPSTSSYYEKTQEGAKDVKMMLVHPSAVIPVISYDFAELGLPSALSQGKYTYFEESFEDVFIFNKKHDAIQFYIEKTA